MKIRSKICGMTRAGDALIAAHLGVDAIGLIFFARSKRCVDIKQAQRILAGIPPFVSVVGLFVNPSVAEVEKVLSQIPLHILQFHGDEPPEFCQQFHRPYIKAVRVKATADIISAAETYADAQALLFDAAVAGEYGGTGQIFDWQLLPQRLSMPWILSGGLNPLNLKSAIAQTGAQAVDVSSGVELSPGIKDLEKMAIFLNNLKIM
jgi:phosphoribosylanthranilate isomerase